MRRGMVGGGAAERVCVGDKKLGVIDAVECSG